MNFNNINPFIRFADTFPMPLKSKTSLMPYDCRLFYILSGHGSITFKDHIYNFQKNDVFFIPSGIEYFLDYPTSEKVVFLSLNFDLNQNYTHITSAMNPCPIKKCDPSKIHQYTDDIWFQQAHYITNYLEIKNELLNIVTEYNKEQFMYQEWTSVLLKKILIELFRYSSLKNLHPHTQLINQIIDYIDNNYSYEITESTLSSVFSYNPHYLNRIFKQETGKTIHQYLIEKRILTAKKLLMMSDLPIDKVALSVGIDNQSHFSYSFKKLVGISPLQYRKKKLP